MNGNITYSSSMSSISSLHASALGFKMGAKILPSPFIIVYSSPLFLDRSRLPYVQFFLFSTPKNLWYRSLCKNAWLRFPFPSGSFPRELSLLERRESCFLSNRLCGSLFDIFSRRIVRVVPMGALAPMSFALSTSFAQSLKVTESVEDVTSQMQ